MRWPFLLSLFCVLHASGQQSDFIVLKKHNKTVKNYFVGTQIEFISNTGAYRNALIERISNDSLFLREFLVQRVPTQLGIFITDTAGSFHYAYHYTQIARMGKKQKGFSLQASGASLLGGGILLTLASGVVYLADRSKFNPRLLIASASLGAVGYLLTRIGRKGIVIGRHGYRIEYVNLTAPKLSN